MTDKERIEQISELLNGLNLDDILDYITSAEYDGQFPEKYSEKLKDKLWIMYCFAEDVRDTINMK